jgi:hypothetical protein
MAMSPTDPRVQLSAGQYGSCTIIFPLGKWEATQNIASKRWLFVVSAWRHQPHHSKSQIPTQAAGNTGTPSHTSALSLGKRSPTL